MARTKEPAPRSVADDPLLDGDEVRRQLGNITERHLQSLRSRRVLVPVRMGRVLRYRQSAVDAFVAALEAEARNR